MSTLKVGTIADTSGASGSTPAQLLNGRIKAWCHFDGTGTVSIGASYNVSSLTDNSTGDYTINFTSGMADTDYTTTVTSNMDGVCWAGLKNGGTYTTSAVQVANRGTSSFVDDDRMNVIVVR